MFEYVGETLRRLRKESGKTLDEIGRQAHLGRGQLSRIENNHQSATLKTLAKVLASQDVSRREFFRRYDLVEAEQIAAKGADGTPAAGSGGDYQREPAAWPTEVREVLARVESFMESTLASDRPVAQGAIELGDFLVYFRVIPKSGGPGARQAVPVAPGAASEPAPKPRRGGRGAPGGDRRKRR